MAANGNENVSLRQLKMLVDSILGETESITFDDVYPVGSIYLSMANTNPGTLFGGTWEKLDNKFILSAGNSYNAGDTGGSNNAVVVSHNHVATATSSGSHSHDATAASNGAHTHGISGGSHTHTATTNSTGGHIHTPTNAGNNTSWITTKSDHEPSCTYTTDHEWAIPYWYTAQSGMNTAGAHSHTVTVSTSSSHSHTISGAGAHTHTVNVDNDGIHTHDITVNNHGVSGIGKNMPEYIAVNAWQRIS